MLVIPDGPEHWNNVKLVLTHFNHLKTFVEIQSYLKMEEKCLKMFSAPNMALIVKGNRPKGNKNSRGHACEVL